MLETCLVQHPFQNRPIIVIYYAHRQTAFTVFIIIIIFFYRRVSPDFSAFLNETEYPAVVCVCVCSRRSFAWAKIKKTIRPWRRTDDGLGRNFFHGYNVKHENTDFFFFRFRDLARAFFSRLLSQKRKRSLRNS